MCDANPHEEVTLLLNSFPVKAGASPLSEFEDLGLGLDTPATRRIPLASTPVAKLPDTPHP
ncbi:uncharacterized protein EI90DRAFT_3123329 [Cantharellus anzutake]|uniref:uncharacterized protein n=1 Tax=Cantharellus anzutake TaxID=1750568 RepID=UPI0019073514|nr:uncharacterized protein EI90DRAFT_3123329 [Cantharellus anzutake]KAF8331724.1 hypothetical protein EI90DRAFT_3123329 [Cantharellus anzutake]